MKLATLPKCPILTLKIAGRYPAGSGYYGRPGTARSDWKRSSSLDRINSLDWQDND